MTSDPSARNTAGRALLFSGHMIDAPDRPEPRFPPSLEPAVARAIESEVHRLQASPGDVAICSGACGGDILFAETVLDAGVPLRIYLPFDEPTFLAKSVSFAGERWTERYRIVAAEAEVLIAPDVLGALAEGEDPYERTNLWMLDEAQRMAGDKVSFVCVWNGEGGDGPGGAQHMMEAVRQFGGAIHWIDIKQLA
ncbi:hypothetical protein [Variovorax sp. GT1P44]|uniref:hypothetical protein n=1 Tax=Variovorax sp. GT1P44 TaxID=3443742 RepID=UPI003F480259